MTNTQALLLTGAITLPAVPWLGVALIGIALLSAGSERRDQFYLFHEVLSSGDFGPLPSVDKCWIIDAQDHRLNEFLTNPDMTLIGVYENYEAARSDAQMICGE